MLRTNGWPSGLLHTKPPPSQNGCSSKTFLQIILAVMWLVRHTRMSMSPKQQRRPLPSLLSDSSPLV